MARKIQLKLTFEPVRNVRVILELASVLMTPICALTPEVVTKNKAFGPFNAESNVCPLKSILYKVPALAEVKAVAVVNEVRTLPIAKPESYLVCDHFL